MKLQKKQKFNFWKGENPLLFLYKDNDFKAKENFVKKSAKEQKTTQTKIDEKNTAESKVAF